MSATPSTRRNDLAPPMCPDRGEAGAQAPPDSRIRRAGRRDAARNRRRILEVAADVLRDEGRDAPVSVLSARSGLGAATIYRHFPSRADLVHALYLRAVERYERAVDAAATEPDVLRRLERLLRLEAAALVECHDCSDWFTATFPDRAHAHRTALRALLDDALAAAHAARLVQAHVTVDDLVLALSAVDGALRADTGDPAVAAQRVVTLVLRGVVDDRR